MEPIKGLNHIAIIPDGNRRWAQKHKMPALEGHRRGAEAMHNVIDYLITRGIRYLTVWGFSTDNWKRSKSETRDLLNLLAIRIETDAPWLIKENVRLHHIGRFSDLPGFLQRAINQAVELTKDNRGLTLNLAFNYTGRAEIVDAARQLVDAILDYEGGNRLIGTTPSERYIDESFLSRYLYTEGMPDVDLVIRTAGEIRMSNFMLWQTAYSEYYFTDVLWPDFDTRELKKALQAYSDRCRRFGGD